MKRYAHVIKVKETHLKHYIELHKSPWASVNQTLKLCNISNYSIYYHKGLLFSYYEYVGENYIEDMLKMNECEKTKEWWALTDPCQAPVEDAVEGEWWKEIEEIFHLD